MSDQIDNDRETGDVVTTTETVALLANIASALTPQSAPHYEAFTTTIAVNAEPVPILGFDMTRKRALMQSSVGKVYFGKRSQLAGGLGFPVGVTQAVELLTSDVVYVALIDPLAVNATASVSIYIESTGQ